MKLLKLLKTITQVFFLLSALIIGGIYLAGRFGYLNPIIPYVVLSGSMEPAISTGSIVFVSPKSLGYKIGDVITFSSGSQQSTTHRIQALTTSEAGDLAYQTKGDANQSPDTILINPQQVTGAVWFTLPYLGYAVDFAKTPQGFILLVIIPATIIVYEELKFLKNQLVTALNKLFNPRSATATVKPPLNLKAKPASAPVAAAKFSTAVHRAPVPPQGHPLEKIYRHLPQNSFTHTAKQVKAKLQSAYPRPNFALLVPITLAFTLFITVSHSVYNDAELSNGNVLGAAADFNLPSISPTPTPGLSPTPTPTPTGVPQFLETFNLNVNEPNGITSATNLQLGVNYRLEVIGTWSNRGGIDTVDADYASYDAFATPGLDGDPAWTAFGLTDFWNLLDTQVDQAFVNWGSYTPSHTYTYDLPGSGSPVNLRVFDGIPESNTPNPNWYTDNSGSLTVNLYQLP